MRKERTMGERYIYGGEIADVADASGVSGILIKTSSGFDFRIYNDDGSFNDYKLKHDDLSVTIAKDSLASFYSHGENHSIDHSPSVLGLKKADDDGNH